MAKPLRPKRGTTAKNDAFTGLASEITIDTDKHSIRVHDGVTAGGHELLPKAKNDQLYLNKAGDTMDGVFRVAEIRGKANDSNVTLMGSNSWGYGSYIELYGQEHATNPGVFRIHCRNMTTGVHKMLEGTLGGRLIWDGKDVITSAGGTMNGPLVCSQGTMMKGDGGNRTYYVLGGASLSSCSWIELTPDTLDTGESWRSPSMMRFCCRDSVNGLHADAQLTPNGSFTWKGSEVERVNSFSSSADGGYIRYESGIQVCWARSVKGAVTFPVPFYHNPSITVGYWTSKATGGTPRYVWAGSPSATGFTVNACELDGTKSVVSADLSYVAIGDWK